jgi:hypothetical protein
MKRDITKTTKTSFDRQRGSKHITVYVIGYDDYPEHGFSVSGITEGHVNPLYKCWSFIRGHDTRKYGSFGGGFESAQAAAEAVFSDLFA